MSGDAEPGRYCFRAAWRSVGTAAVAWTWLTVPIMPARVAVHFGSDGRANGWSSRLEYAATTTLLLLTMMTILSAAPALIRRVPARWVNLPHRDYWLAPERREATLRRIEGLLDRVALPILSFHLYLGILVVDANRSEPVRLSNGWLAAGLSVLAVGITAWIVVWYRSFRLPRPA